MDYVNRAYRRGMRPAGFAGFNCKYKETDLYVAVDEKSFVPELVKTVEKRIFYYRFILEEYIRRDRDFQITHKPYLLPPTAPLLARAMAKAGNMAGTGPMAAVAGAFAEFIGHDLLQFADEVIVENGGDIFLAVKEKAKISVFAGESPLSNRLALELKPQENGFGVCTSSGTVGHSFSYGRADAVVIVSPSAILADAVATAAANLVQTSADLQKAVDFARNIEGITGVLAIKDDKIAAWGDIKLVRV